jgi:hypothetical protein
LVILYIINKNVLPSVVHIKFQLATSTGFGAKAPMKLNSKIKAR